MKIPYYIKGAALLILVFLSSCKKDDNYIAYFGGEVINPRSPYIFLSKDNKIIDTLKIDKANRFFVRFDSLTPGLYVFKHDPEYQYIYFDKNDSIMVSINAAEFDESIVFSGRGERKNNFFIELFLMNEEDRSTMYRIYEKDYTVFKNSIDSSHTVRTAFYEKNKKNIKWNEEFDYYAKKRLELHHYAKHEYYPYVHLRRTGNEVYSQLPKDYYSFRKNIDFNDSRLTNFSPFVRYLTAMLNNTAMSQRKDKEAENSLENNIRKLNIADTLFSNENTKNEVLNNIAFSYLLEDQNIINNKAFLERYLELSTDNSEENEIRKIAKAIQDLTPGKKLPPLALVDINNNAFDLETEITKETVIFFWTGCAKSHLEKAYQKISALQKTNPNIDFIAINFDEENEFKKTVEKYNHLNVIQVRANNFKELKDKWAFTKINRTIVLNSNGTIKNAFTNLFDANFSENLK